MSRIEDVLYADSLTQTSSPARSDMSSNTDEDAARLSTSETPTLSDFMGWDVGSARCNTSDQETHLKSDYEKKTSKPPFSPTPRKASYLDKLENLNGLRSPDARDL